MTRQSPTTQNSGRTQSAPTQTRNYHHVYISPHFDDVPLSCGGQISAQTEAGERVLVVTVCSQIPLVGLKRTPFAAAMERDWQTSSGNNTTDTYLARQAEEEHALQRLGAQRQWLDYLDAIYRRADYDSDITLFGAVIKEDIAETLPQLQSNLAAIVMQNPDATFYFPLAVGNHVDHQLANLAGRVLAAQGYRVLFYEDFPYAGNGEALEQRLAQIPLKLHPALTDIHATLDDKIAAIATYTSQLGILFGGEAAMRDQVRSYAMLIAQGEGLAERYWQPISAEC